MFDDFFSTSRGPGFVGFLLAALVLGGFTGLAMIAFEDSDGKVPLAKQVENESLRITELEASLKNEKARSELLREFQNKREELVKGQSTLESARQALEGKRAELQAATDEVEAAISRWEEYKGKYRASERGFAKGEVYDFSDTLGAEFREARVREINAIEMRVMLEHGPKSIAYERLPKAVQDRFQFDAEEAQAMRDEMVRLERALQAGGAQARERQTQQQMEAQAAASAGNISRYQKQIARYRHRIERNEKAITDELASAERLRRDHQTARSRGGISMHLGLARQAEARAASLRQQNVELAQKISQLEQDMLKN